MALREGKMSTKELAEWFGLTPGSFRNKKKEKLEELKNYCDFEEMPNKRGVIISTVDIPNYSKDLNFDKLYHQYVLDQVNYITSAAGMARKLIVNDERFENADEESLAKRFRRAGKRTYGETNLLIQEEPNEPGYCGSRKYVWAIKLDDFNSYRLKSKEEEKIYQEILTKYANSKEAKEILENNALLDQSVKDGDISAEQAQSKRKDANNFFTYVIKPFREETGLQLAKATEHEVYESMKKRGLSYYLE